MTTLSQLHRADQVKIAASSVSQIVSIWSAFDPQNIDETWPAIENAAMGVIGNSRRRSAILSDAYYRSMRSRAGVRGALPREELVPDGWETAARLSLNVTGNFGAKAAILRKIGLPEVANIALVRVSGAVSRHSLDGGRYLLGRYTRAERGGWRRVTSGSPCAFCAMLRDRGAVYGRDTVNFESHDHCSCTSEPVFR